MMIACILAIVYVKLLNDFKGEGLVNKEMPK